MRRVTLRALLLVLATAVPLVAQVPYERILDAASEPGSWLTYSGTYGAQRYSTLDQINRDNVHRLQPAWVYQVRSTQKFEVSPLVVDGVMYITEPPSDATALDLRTGRPIWSYRRSLPEGIITCCGQVNRGVALLDDQVFLGTVDAHLVALDARTGRVNWDIEVADYRGGYAITVAPLALKDKIIVGIAGGEYGIRGFLDAYDPTTGERLWRFWTVPGPGEPGHETWSGDSWERGGAPTWVTGTYDPELDLLYWGTGNPGPDYIGEVREGDNLYSESLLALDPDTGELKWYFQFLPHDIPNSLLASSIVKNFSMPKRALWVSIEVGVSYDSDLDHAEAVALDVAKQVLNEVDGGVPGEDPIVRYHTFADSSVNFEVRMLVREFESQGPVRHAFIKRLQRRFIAEGIEIPFPIRTVVMKGGGSGSSQD